MTETQTQPEGDTQAPESAGEERLYAGKYKSAEELEKGYQALQSKLGDQASDEASNQAAAVEEAGEAATSIFGEEQMQEWGERVRESGDLTPEDYSAITEKTGFSAEMVRTYVEGLKRQAVEATAEQEAALAPYYELAGGKEQYQTVLEWAAQNVKPDQVAQINAELESGNPVRMTTAIQRLVATHQQHTSQTPAQRITGQPGAVGGLQPFRSEQEWLAAQAKANASGDPAQMADVQARLRQSMQQGTLQ